MIPQKPCSAESNCCLLLTHFAKISANWDASLSELELGVSELA